MQQSDPKASGSGLTQKIKKEEEWTAKETHFTDDKHKGTELPESPNWSSLIELYLQEKYELTAVPPLFFQQMSLLQVLDLSRTSIKSLPKSLPTLVSLKRLLLRGCELLMELSPEVGKLENLEDLDLDETQIIGLPRQIKKLLKLRRLTVSFYHVCVKKKSKSNVLIHPKMMSILSQLTDLSIDVNPEDERWDDSVEAVVKEVSKSKSLSTLSLYLPEFQLLHKTSFIYPSLSRFRFTVGRHEWRIVSRVPREVEAGFRKWSKCLKFVNGENIPIEIKRVLNYTVSFFLDNHATARNLSEFGIENMKGLRFCLLVDCDEMETVIDERMHYERNEDNQSEPDPGSIEYVLESLEYLSVYYMENLRSIWRGSNRYGCMSKLKFLALHTCPQLSNIFSCTLIENFVNLEVLILEDCSQLTSLVGDAPNKPIMSDKIFLPSLKRLLLLDLPELVSISNGLLIAPKLESIGFYNCPKLKSVSKRELSSEILKVIKGERQWWKDMNWNETEWGSCPDYLTRIFSPINDERDVMTQLVEGTDLFEFRIQEEGQQLEVKFPPQVSKQKKRKQPDGKAARDTELTVTGFLNAQKRQTLSVISILKESLSLAELSLKEKERERAMLMREKQKMLALEADKTKLLNDFMDFIEAIENNDPKIAQNFDEKEMMNAISGIMENKEGDEDTKVLPDFEEAASCSGEKGGTDWQAAYKAKDIGEEARWAISKKQVPQ